MVTFPLCSIMGNQTSCMRMYVLNVCLNYVLVLCANVSVLCECEHMPEGDVGSSLISVLIY